MRSEPLDFFEKIAEELPEELAEDLDLKDSPEDAGEAALTGLTVGASMLATLGPTAASYFLGGAAMKGSKAWPAHSPGPKKTVDGVLYSLDSAYPNLPEPQAKKFMGLFPIKEKYGIKSTSGLDDAVDEMRRMQPSVDSFIEKYDLPKKGVKIHFKRGPLTSFMGPHYDITKKRVNMPTFSEATTLHELGHAADYTGSRVGKIRGWAEPAIRRGMLTSLPIALIAGDEIKRALPGTVDDHIIEFMQQNAPALMGATLAATTLYPEGKATALALKHVRMEQGPKAMRAMARKLIPAWGTYVLGTVAPMIGMSLAKKYYNEAKARGDDIEKRSDIARTFKSLKAGIIDLAGDLSHAGREIGNGTRELVRDPQRMQRIGRAAKEVGTDPKFVEGALLSGIPAAAATAYLYSSRHGGVVQERLNDIDPIGLGQFKQTGGRLTEHAKDRIPEEWKRNNPGLYAGLVGAGAAFSGGVLTKLFSDLMHVL